MNRDEKVVAVLDILGYSRLMQTLSLDELEALIVEGVMGALFTAKLLSGDAIVVGETGELYEYGDLIDVEYGIISDTIVLYPKARASDPLGALCTTVSLLMSQLLSSNILLRGGIAVGTFRAIRGHPIYIGGAMIAAHQIEAAQEWSGCALSPAVGRRFRREVKLLRSNGLIVDYPIPFKTSTPKQGLCKTAINWFHFALNSRTTNEHILRSLLSVAPIGSENKVREAINFARTLKERGLYLATPVSKQLFDRSRIGGAYRFAPRQI